MSSATTSAATPFLSEHTTLTPTDVSKETKPTKEQTPDEPVIEEPQGKSLSSADKWKYTLYTTIIFLLVANPYTYMIVHTFLGRFVYIANKKGCPSWKGFLIHALVFTLILRAIM